MTNKMLDSARMRFEGGHWWCRLCGARLEGVSAATLPQIEYMDRGDLPQLRVLEVEGKEIHRCEAPHAP
jgi:hypothetical protein